MLLWIQVVMLLRCCCDNKLWCHYEARTCHCLRGHTATYEDKDTSLPSRTHRCLRGRTDVTTSYNVAAISVSVLAPHLGATLPLMHIMLAIAPPLWPHDLWDSFLHIALAACLSAEDIDALKTLKGLLKIQQYNIQRLSVGVMAWSWSCIFTSKVGTPIFILMWLNSMLRVWVAYVPSF